MLKKILSYAVLLSMIFGLTGCGSSDKKSDINSNNSPQKQEEKKEEKKELSESDKMILKRGNLFDEKLAFDTGNYIEAEIPSGEYAFVKFDGSGSYYSEEDAAGNIIDNENFSSFGYVKVYSHGNLETQGALVNITAFDKLGVKGAKELYEILNDKKDWNQSGFYKVGYDLEPGKYVVESTGSGYWAILTGPVGSNDIVKNDNFNGKAKINLSKGQYLELYKAIIYKAE